MGIVTALWVLFEQSACYGLESASIHLINLSVHQVAVALTHTDTLLRILSESEILQK